MRKISFCCVLAVLFISGSAFSQMPDIGKSVVMIQIAKQPWNFSTPWMQNSMGQGVGSGFIIAGNRILTNAHNVADYKYLILKKDNVAKRYPAYVEFVGHDCDLAILKVTDANFFDDTAPLAIATLPQVNTTVSTHGFPMGGTHISVTEGIVSRIQMDVYVHSGADSHLVVQTDAAINPGNSGGPVMQQGKVVGVAFQGLLQADNIGYMIPTTVIEHFLDDVNDGHYDGFGSLGVSLFPGLHNQSYKDYLKIPAGQEGMVITSTLLNSSAETVLQKGDVVTKIDGYDIDNDGMIMIYGMKYHMSQAVETKQIDDSVDIEFYRNGTKKNAHLQIQLNRPVFEYARQYDYQPRYVCFAGMTFVPATRNLLETFGSEWASNMPHILRYLFSDSMQLNTDRQRREYIVLSEILPDEITAYAKEFQNKPLESINGSEIRSVEDVEKAFSDKKTEFYILKFMGSDKPLSINAKKAHTANAKILKKYNVTKGAFTEHKI
ncbi:MAG: trypsin-like peptidase domain-containing protein [Anaerohalosphaeraceae bacterium]|nr:trypsin-like peptidase domain-containing protein [Anaerohalosphaeraceae bacterium]